jgi:hypothetical protein
MAIFNYESGSAVAVLIQRLLPDEVKVTRLIRDSTNKDLTSWMVFVKVPNITSERVIVYRGKVLDHEVIRLRVNLLLSAPPENDHGSHAGKPRQSGDQESPQ